MLGTALVLAVAGCASVGAPQQPSDPSPLPIDGLPLYLAPDQAATAIQRKTGAAGAFVQCRTEVTGDFRPGRYEGGETGRTPRKGLQRGLDEGALDGPQRGYVEERREDGRSLFTVRNEGVIKMAVILVKGPALGAPAGWHPESWARCDLSEFPVELAEADGLQLWIGRDGRPAPIDDIQSSIGPEHCDWQAMTFLRLGDGERTYVRNPDQAYLGDYFAEDWDPRATLPKGAYDTGYSRGQNHLWLSSDRRRAYVGEVGGTHVEMWPRTTQLLGCI